MDGRGLTRGPRRLRGVFSAVLIVMSMGLLFACATGNGFSSDSESENPLTLTPVKIPAVNSRSVPAGQYVFKNSQEWSLFWSKYHVTPLPDIDLEESTLLAVFLGRKPHAGYSVGIAGAAERGDEIVVDVVEYLPAPGMMYAQMIVYPYDMSLIPKTGKEIRFEVSNKSGRP